MGYGSSPPVELRLTIGVRQFILVWEFSACYYHAITWFTPSIYRINTYGSMIIAYTDVFMHLYCEILGKGTVS